MAESIDIPEEAWATKAVFKERPGRDIVREIKAHVLETGKPWLWWGHTHTEPPPGSIVEYLDEFNLPKRCRKNRALWAPCPCCTPRAPKYHSNGKIGWFRDEGVIRLLGPDCFKRISGEEAHEEALKNMRLERQQRYDLAFLEANLPFAARYIEIAEIAEEVAFSLTSVSWALTEGLEKTFDIRIWDHVSGGQVSIISKVRNERGKEQDALLTYAQIEGYEFLRPKRIQKPYGRDIPAARGLLNEAMQPCSDDFARAAAVKAFSRGAARIRREVDRIERDRRFCSAGIAIPTLEAWGSRPDATAQIYLHLEGEKLFYGRSADVRLFIPISQNLWRVIPSLPRILVPEID